jgi:hypothetical protein
LSVLRYIPEGLLDALGEIVAEQRKEWTRERERIETEARALLAETEVKFQQIIGDLCAENASLRASTHDAIEAELKDLRAQVAQLKDGEPGPPGKDADEDAIVARVRALIPDPEPGPPGHDGVDGKDAELDFDYIQRSIADAVHQRLPELRGDPGDPETLLPIIERMVDDAVAAKPIPDPLPGPPGPAGERGADAQPLDPAEVVPLVLAALPPPQKGDPGEPGRDGRAVAAIKRVGDQIVVTMTDGELMSFDDIRGPAGERGEDVDPDVVAVMIEESVRRTLAEWPQPQDGKDGRDGKDAEVDYELIFRELRGDLSQMVATLPPPKDGEPGKDAEIDYQLLLDELLPFAKTEVMEQVAKAISALPPSEPGTPGRDGKDADMELVARWLDERIAALPVPKDGRDGKDGVGIAGALIDREHRLLLTLSDGTVRDLGIVVGKDGVPGTPGRDGKDGLSFESFVLEPEFDGQRTARLRWTDAKGNEQTREWRLPIVTYKGVWRADVSYEVGDSVSRGGSCWIATANTSEPPAEGASGWVLSTKRGRDGRDGTPGERGPEGPAGRPGRDLTNLGQK